MANPAVRCSRLWTPEGVQEDVTVCVDERGRIAALRPGSPSDGAVHEGLVVPGLINAHAHLELSDRAGTVPGGAGFVDWVDALFSVPAGDAGAVEAAGRAAAVLAYELGTAYLIDVSNTGHTAAWIADAGLAGVVQHERLGLDAGRVHAVLAEVAHGHRLERGVVVRSSPHALFSTALEIVTACLEAGPDDVPATLHVGESEHEAEFLAHGTGPHAELLDRLGRDWRWWEAPGLPALELLDLLGALGPRLLLVHAVHTTPAERALAAASGAPVVLCPRSNLHVGGRLPDAPAWLASGAPLALGTDALVSNHDLDVLGEVACLGQAFPDLPMTAWLALATHRGAEAVGARGHGRFEVGAAPGLLQLDVDSPEALRAGPPARRWLVPPRGVPGARRIASALGPNP